MRTHALVNPESIRNRFDDFYFSMKIMTFWKSRIPEEGCHDFQILTPKLTELTDSTKCMFGGFFACLRV